jgi:glucose-1-phosphate adenylyltransferase
MDYEEMLNYHKANNADITLATIQVPWEEASRFGVTITDENMRITEFEEKPKNPRSNLASMGIYIFTWKVLREALLTLQDQEGCDFGKHIIPYCHNRGDRVFAYEFKGYWKDVGTLGSYWAANMELIDIVPVFDLYDEFWKIYTKSDIIRPQYIADTAVINRAIISEGTEVYGEVHNSVIGAGVVIEEGAVVRDSIIMKNCVIGKGTYLEKAIIGENTVVGENCKIGVGESVPNEQYPKIYGDDLVTVGEDTVIPDGVTVGKNTVISGGTAEDDYINGILPSGGSLIKAGDRR